MYEVFFLYQVSPRPCALAPTHRPHNLQTPTPAARSRCCRSLCRRVAAADAAHVAVAVVEVDPQRRLTAADAVTVAEAAAEEQVRMLEAAPKMLLLKCQVATEALIA